MFRDMELVRAILLAVEAAPPLTMADTEIRAERVQIEGYDDLIVTQHIELLAQAGLVSCGFIPYGPLGYSFAHGVRLTWEGHDFLDNARSDTRWRTAQAMMKRAGNASVDVLKAVLAALAKEQLGLGGPGSP